jgi:hypothetical protein
MDLGFRAEPKFANPDMDSRSTNSAWWLQLYVDCDGPVHHYFAEHDWLVEDSDLKLKDHQLLNRLLNSIFVQFGVAEPSTRVIISCLLPRLMLDTQICSSLQTNVVCQILSVKDFALDRHTLETLVRQTSVYKLLRLQYLSDCSGDVLLTVRQKQALDWLFVVCFARMLFPPKSGLHLEDGSWKFPQHIRIIGPGGCGKSVFLRHLVSCFEVLHLGHHRIQRASEGDIYRTFTYSGGLASSRIAVESDISGFATVFRVVTVCFPNSMGTNWTDYLEATPEEAPLLYRWSSILYLMWLRDPHRFVIPELLRNSVQVS